MPKKIIKRFLPDHQTIKDQKVLAMFGSVLHDPNLWHLNRRSAAGAFGIGMFFAWWPVPFQMWLSAASAIPLRVNLPLSVATVWITNPFTMPPMFYGAYLLGVALIGAPPQEFSFELSWSWVVQSMETIGPAFLLGCGVLSVVCGAAGYLGLNMLWRWSVRKAWRTRCAQRKAIARLRTEARINNSSLGRNKEP
ncbi:DUF2062 domain-containing protein [Aestuariibacter halophilus]|uniref:DUF2062 domain-containing protein n=1 Tax=Fluctibacter halophilus TaxID=226011 RepID=A0ABS8G486_9ALTE|nr:DUF2062 domain-containing protein [Aestuariibacter halophilus]MCC2615340.1 DUF2062 domain-containing protein [Aestuariibacter halophilus]